MNSKTRPKNFLFTETRTESKGRWNKNLRIALLSVVGASLFLLPGLTILFPSVHATAGTVVVGPANQTAVGWQTLQGIFGEPGPDTGTQKYVLGPATPPLGAGSLEFKIGSNNNWSEAVGYTGLNGVGIGAASLTELSYSTYVKQSSNAASQDFFAILVIDTNGDQTADDFLFFYPADQSGCSDGAPTQHTITQNQWQQPWDARNGVWVSAFGLCNAQESCGTANDPKTLAEYLACSPTARIINDSDGTPGLIVGYGGSTVSMNFIGNLDNVRVGVAGMTTAFDFEPCVVTCPNDITQPNDPDQCGAVVNYADPTTNEGCSGTATCSPASGSFFPVGATTVTCLEQVPVLGPIKNAPSVTCTPQTITESTSQTITDNNSYSCGSGVSYWRAFDLANSFSITHDFDVQSVDIGIQSATSAPGPGQPLTIRLYANTGGAFPGGTLTQIATADYTISDQALTVVNLPITADVPAGSQLVVEVFAPNGPNNLFVIGSNTDPETGPSYVSAPGCGIASPTATADIGFPDMHIVMNVKGCEEVPGCTFTVTVQDTQPPSITCPPNQNVSNDPNQCGAVMNYPPPTASDNCPGVTASCSPASGSFFPKGTTTVTCTAKDASPNSPDTTCTFTVTVNDTQKPTITCPANITKPNDPNQCAAVVTYPPPTVTDNCTGAGTPVCSPASGSLFPKGTTTVTCNVSDASGNTASCTFTITVNDTQPPTITCPASINTAAASSCPIGTTSGPVSFTVTATDNCPGVTFVCKNQNNQVVTPGQPFPVGTTTVTCTATDTSGNTSSCSFAVTAFSLCLQDETNPGNVVLFNTQTGQYRFCCNGSLAASGTGVATVRGCQGTIDDQKGDRKVHIAFDTSANAGKGAGTAYIAIGGSGTPRCAITDKNMSDNTCSCQ